MNKHGLKASNLLEYISAKYGKRRDFNIKFTVNEKKHKFTQHFSYLPTHSFIHIPLLATQDK